MKNVEEYNARYLEVLSRYLNFYDTIVKKDAVEAVASCGVSEETAFSLILAEAMGVDTEKDKEFFNSYFIPSIKKLEITDLYGDFYYKTVKFSDQRSGDVELKNLSYAPYQGFVRDDYLYFEDGRVVPQIGFFDGEYRYPAVLKGGVEWMTLLPNEINSQKKYIEKAFGNVLCYGLGLGYFALMVAMKSCVKKITVVDIDEGVIKLFKEKILPQFPDSAQKKIEIVNADAFKFAENLRDGEFDYIYADIWRDCGDGAVLYKKFKELEKFSPSTRFGYWIEDSIKYYL